MYKIERGKEIVFSGFQNGIADSPEAGFGLMKNVNIISVPGEASVGFVTDSVTLPPSVSGANATFDQTTDIVTSAGAVGAGLYNQCAVTFGNTTGGVTAGAVYWVGNLSGSTFKIYDHISCTGSAVNLTGDVSNTISTVQATAMKQYATSLEANVGGTPSYPNYNFFLDESGRAWFLNTSNALVFLGNTTLTNASGNGLCVLGGTASAPGYLMVFREQDIDYLSIDALTSTGSTASAWGYGWESSISGVSGTSHQAIIGQDNAMYFCNVRYAGRVVITPGSVFDPTSSGTYTFDEFAREIPNTDEARCLAELGENLLIGGKQNLIYTWDRVSPNLGWPIPLPETNVKAIVSTLQSAYIFVGNRGRIYITNGSAVELFKKVPDYLTGTIDPYFVWGGALFWKNQLYFSFSAYTNAGVATSSTTGAWGIDLTSGALRLTNNASIGASGNVPIIAPDVRSSTPGGAGLIIARTSTTGMTTTYGILVTTSDPHTDIDSGTSIDTDLVPVGTFQTPYTFSQVEYKTSVPLVSGETIRISYRLSRSGAFTPIATFSSETGLVSDVSDINFENAQWLQLRIEMASTETSPTWIPLTEVRIK